MKNYGKLTKGFMPGGKGALRCVSAGVSQKNALGMCVNAAHESQKQNALGGSVHTAQKTRPLQEEKRKD